MRTLTSIVTSFGQFRQVQYRLCMVFSYNLNSLSQKLYQNRQMVARRASIQHRYMYFRRIKLHKTNTRALSGNKHCWVHCVLCTLTPSRLGHLLTLRLYYSETSLIRHSVGPENNVGLGGCWIMGCLLPYLCMVTVPHVMVGLERMLDYRGVGSARFHCTTRDVPLVKVTARYH